MAGNIFEAFNLFKIKNASVHMEGVDTDLARMPAALTRAFTSDVPTERAAIAKKGFVEITVTDAQDRGLRSWASMHKSGRAMDMSLRGFPEIPDISMPDGTDRRGNEKFKTLTGDKAKEQFLADVATVVGMPKTAVSIHDVSFGKHIHVELGEGRGVRGFNPAKSAPDSAQAVESAASRLEQVFGRLGLDGKTALARLKDEDGVRLVIEKTLGTVTRVAGDAAKKIDLFGTEAREQKKQQLAERKAVRLATKAGFLQEGGDERFAAVHDYVMQGKDFKGEKPDRDSIRAYQAILATRKIDVGHADGRVGEKTRTAAAEFKKQYPSLDSAGLAQAALGSHAESPKALAATTPAVPAAPQTARYDAARPPSNSARPEAPARAEPPTASAPEASVAPDISAKIDYVLKGKALGHRLTRDDKKALQKDLTEITGLKEGLDDGRFGKKTAAAAREAQKVLSGDANAMAKAAERKKQLLSGPIGTEPSRG